MNKILIIPITITFLLFYQLASAQVEITGKVIGADLIGIPGVIIGEKDTINNTVSDIEGNFKLTVSDKNSMLVISYVGYNSEEVRVGNKEQVFIIVGDAGNTKYWCCTDHATPDGPHCDTDKQTLIDLYGCKSFQRAN